MFYPCLISIFAAGLKSPQVRNASRAPVRLFAFLWPVQAHFYRGPCSAEHAEHAEIRL